ncbi:hypothetical protein LCGC14_2149750, partial [marine sediment metagenome]
LLDSIEQLRTITDQLLAKGGNLLSPNKQKMLIGVGQVWSDRMEAMAAARIESDAIMKRFTSTIIRRDRTQAQWTKALKEAEAPWDKFHAKDGVFLNQQNALTKKAFGSKIPGPPQVVDRLTVTNVAHIFGSNAGDVRNNLLFAETRTMMGKTKFNNHVYAQAENVAKASGTTPEAIGFSRDAVDDLYDRMLVSMGSDPKTASVFEPAMKQFEMFKSEADVLLRTAAVDPKEYAGVQAIIERTARNLEQLPQFAKKSRAKGMGAKNAQIDAAKVTWDETRQTAGTNAAKEYLNTFTDYTDQNMMDSFMKSIFPFWTYESQRYPFLAHLSMARPGTAANLGRWMDYTDGGYVNLFGMPIDLNPFRGSVWMGGFRRFLMKDYPEFFDAPGFSGIAEMFDAVSRGGFYPNIVVTGALSLWGSKEKGSQLYELLTPPFATLLNMYYVLDSESTVSKFLQESIFNDRFKDYQIRQALIGAGYEGDVIMAKRSEGFELTEVEQAAISAANRKVAITSVPSIQFGVFRYHEPDRNAAYEMALTMQSHFTGVDVDELRMMNATSDVTGSSASDRFPLSIGDQKLLREAEIVAKWNRNITAPLMPSTWSRQDDRVTLYYNEMKNISETAKSVGFEDYTDEQGNIISWDWLDAEFKAGRISGA